MEFRKSQPSFRWPWKAIGAEMASHKVGRLTRDAPHNKVGPNGYAVRMHWKRSIPYEEFKSGWTWVFHKTLTAAFKNLHHRRYALLSPPVSLPLPSSLRTGHADLPGVPHTGRRSPRSPALALMGPSRSGPCLPGGNQCQCGSGTQALECFSTCPVSFKNDQGSFQSFTDNCWNWVISTCRVLHCSLN